MEDSSAQGRGWYNRSHRNGHPALPLISDRPPPQFESAPSTAESATVAGPSDQSHASRHRNSRLPNHLAHRTPTSPLRRSKLRHYLGRPNYVPYFSPLETDKAAAYTAQHSHVHTHGPDGRCFVAFRCETCFCTTISGEVMEMFVPARWLNPMNYNPWDDETWDCNPIPDKHRDDMDSVLALTPWYIQRLQEQDMLETETKGQIVLPDTREVDARKAPAENQTKAAREMGRVEFEGQVQREDSGVVPGLSRQIYINYDQVPTRSAPEDAATAETSDPVVVNGSG